MARLIEPAHVELSLQTQAEVNKKFLIKQTQEYLKHNDNNTILQTDRTKIQKKVESGDFTKALQDLEILREQNIGITITKIEGKDEATPIIIRDARNAKDPRVLSTESFEMQYINTIRAAIDLVKIEKIPQLEKDLQKKANDFITNFNKNNVEKSQQEISASVKAEIGKIAIFLGRHGIKNAYKKLNVAKDFQNLNDEHYNVVTISNVKDNNNNLYTIIEAEVALRGLTEAQRKEYANINSDQEKPSWFLRMSNWESKIVEKYVSQITGGSHTISTQLRQIVGMKNAFEKITAVVDKNSNLEIIHTSKHAGTLSSFSRDARSRDDITVLNTKQAQEWIGENKKLHTNTLNSGSANYMLPNQDAEIVRRTNLAMYEAGGINTNTAFNKFRLFGLLNNLIGVKRVLNELADKLDTNDIAFNDLKSHIKPRGFFSRLFSINSPKGEPEEIINTLFQNNKINEDTVNIFKTAVNLRKDVETADVPFKLFGDQENINLNISQKLNYLSNKISASQDNLLGKVPKYEVLTMCASGKDRTGLAEHDQTSIAIATKLKIDIKDVDKALLNTGHTANLAGSVYTGGATIGCYGTLAATSQGFPKDRKDALANIMEVSASNNKIIGYSKKIDKEYQKNNKRIKFQDTKVLSDQAIMIDKPSPTPKLYDYKDRTRGG